MAYKNLSFYDLMSIPVFKLAAKLNDEDTMERIFWQCGLDTTKDYEIKWCTHRAVTTNVAQENYMVFGVSRSDDEFIKSGFASLDDILGSVKDVSMIEELKSLDPRAAKDFDEDKELNYEYEFDGDED